MPIIGAITGGVDFSNYFFPLSKAVTATTLAEAKKQGTVLAFGNFITTVVNFIIIAWALFLVVKAINQLKQPKADAAPPPRQEVLLQEIRDALIKRLTRGARRNATRSGCFPSARVWSKSHKRTKMQHVSPLCHTSDQTKP
jgi:large conductance mechanosensitive channel